MRVARMVIGKLFIRFEAITERTVIEKTDPDTCRENIILNYSVLGLNKSEVQGIREMRFASKWCFLGCLE